MGAEGSPPAITFENNDKIWLSEQAENGFVGGVGGATGTGVEQSLGRNQLKLLEPVLRAVVAPFVLSLLDG
jgi:hypothetical protein